MASPIWYAVGGASLIAVGLMLGRKSEKKLTAGDVKSLPPLPPLSPYKEQVATGVFLSPSELAKQTEEAWHDLFQLWAQHQPAVWVELCPVGGDDFLMFFYDVVTFGQGGDDCVMGCDMDAWGRYRKAALAYFDSLLPQVQGTLARLIFEQIEENSPWSRDRLIARDALKLPPRDQLLAARQWLWTMPCSAGKGKRQSIGA